MADKKPAPKPVYVLNLEREISKKLFTEGKAHPSRTDRDSITQEGISLCETEFPSEFKPRGPAKGKFSEMGQGSFKFGLPSESGKSQNTKRAECMPVNRNPITQDHPSLVPQVYTKSNEQYSKVRDSTLFNNKSETVLVRPRDNQYYQTMKSSIFGNEVNDSQYRAQLKQVGTKESVVGNIMRHNDGTKPEKITDKPTGNYFNRLECNQVKELSSHARVYNARRNQSAITFG